MLTRAGSARGRKGGTRVSTCVACNRTQLRPICDAGCRQLRRRQTQPWISRRWRPAGRGPGGPACAYLPCAAESGHDTCRTPFPLAVSPKGAATAFARPRSACPHLEWAAPRGEASGFLSPDRGVRRRQHPPPTGETKQQLKRGERYSAWWCTAPDTKSQRRSSSEKATLKRNQPVCRCSL